MTREALRWTICAIIVVAAHTFAWRALSTKEPASESDAGSPIVTLELSLVLAAPTSPPDEPAPDAQPTEALTTPPPPVEAAAPTKDEPPPKLDDPQPAKSDLPPAKSDPPPPGPEVVLDAIAPPRQAEDVTAKPPPPPAPEKFAVLSPPPSELSAATPSVADIPAAPEIALGSEEATPPAGVQRWRQALIAQIERHKRFPANAKGRSGVVSVAFSIDRGGRLTEVRVLASSGSAVLDEAAIVLIRQSQPFPTPPPALAENELSFVAPIRYLPSGAH